MLVKHEMQNITRMEILLHSTTGSKAPHMETFKMQTDSEMAHRTLTTGQIIWKSIITQNDRCE